MARKCILIWTFWLGLFGGCAREEPPAVEEPPPEDWLLRREAAARAAGIEAVLDQALVAVGRDDAAAYLLVREARADLLSAARRTPDPEKRRILIEAHRDLEPVEVFLEGTGELGPPPSESDLDWIRESIVTVRVSLAPVSDGYADKLYGRYRPARTYEPAPAREMGPRPPERPKPPKPPPEPVKPETPVVEEIEGSPAESEAEPAPADEGE